LAGIGVARTNSAALALVQQASMQDQIDFRYADVRQRLPFRDQAFDVIVCQDGMCHLIDRRSYFQEWSRVLRPGGRLLYTDLVVVTRLVAKEEFAIVASFRGNCR
jgi:ubiquinone/menaquinone biosynthesis C-methylase UbiE